MLGVAGCLVLLVPLALGLSTTDTKYDYDGHKLLKIFHKTPEDFRKLVNSELEYELDFWKMPRHENDSMVVNVPPHKLSAFLDELNHLGTSVTVMVENLKDMIDSVDADNQHHRRKRAASPKNFLETYNSYTDILNYLSTTAANSQGLATVQTIGQSVEGRDIKVLKISTGGSNKQKIFIDGGIHAREWISPAAVLYFIDQLMFGTDTAINVLLTSYDVYLCPVLNPDGYEYSRTNYRLWRKNRRNYPGNCDGVDLNRNFPFEWNPNVGGSTSSCQDIFSGDSPGSEPETQALVQFLRTNNVNNDMIAYLTIHSYGQMWLYPWGYTSAYPSDAQDLHNAAVAAVTSLYKESGNQTDYLIGSSTNVLYSAAGGSDDFAKGDAGVKYSYTLELRDKGRYGFVLPESLITPTCEETFAGFIGFTQYLTSVSSSQIVG